MVPETFPTVIWLLNTDTQKLDYMINVTYEIKMILKQHAFLKKFILLFIFFETKSHLFQAGLTHTVY